jgi:hypothetical protein
MAIRKKTLLSELSSTVCNNLRYVYFKDLGTLSLFVFGLRNEVFFTSDCIGSNAFTKVNNIEI